MLETDKNENQVNKGITIMALTIREQIAAIPRPKLEGVETAPGHIEFHIAQKAVRAAVEPVRVVESKPEPTEQYVNLGTLSDREAARMALKCWFRDVRNFGRTDKYHEFKAKRWAEQDLAFDMEVGLVDKVHCRLHEKMIEQKQGV